MRISLAALLLVACNGVIGDPLTNNPNNPDPNDPNNPIDPVEVCEDDVCVGRSGIPRLTRTQYRHSVRQLFGTSVTVDTDRLPADHTAGPFSSNDAFAATGPAIDLYSDMARGVAAQVVDGDRAFVECETNDLACLIEVVDTMTPRAYRRPITEEERSGYVDLLTWVMEDDDFDTALSVYVETILQSPNFIYRVEESGSMEDPRRLSAHEVATRLALFLFREGPDAELLEAAQAGDLDTAEGVMARARMMLDDSRSDRAINEFHREWLGVDHLADVSRLDEALTTDIRNDMRRETERFAREVMREGEGSLEQMLTARWSVLNPRMSDYYGAEGPSDGWARVDMEERAGILTTGGVMTAHGSETFTQPVHRGLFVRTRVLCQELPSPADAGIDTDAAVSEGEELEDMNDRERLAFVTESGEPCASCHTVMNSIGYGFEAFDPIGRFRMADSTGAMLDINGEIRTPERMPEFETDVDGAFIGAHELGERLADSTDVARCLSRQWFRFGTQRKETTRDERAIEAVYEAFAASGFQIREAMIAVTGTEGFLHRMPRLQDDEAAE